MKIEQLEQIERQLRPEGWIALMAALLVLTLLGAYLYLLRPSLATYGELSRAWSPDALAGTEARAISAETETRALELEVSELGDRLHGGSSSQPIEQMESYVIGQLDRLTAERGIQLVSVSPGEVGELLMFDELPFDVDVAGPYFALHDWLGAVEDELRPLVVKSFEMTPNGRSSGVSMRLRLVAYRTRDA